jgi:hypothetical protein
MLTQQNKEAILMDFPNIKLSYENITHKKVYTSDLIIGIPEGTKCLIWFTFYDDNQSCICLELNQETKNNKIDIRNIKIISACFSESLCYGTIFYGTLFYHMNNKFFSIEDIFLNKGENCSRENWLNKFKIISNILKNDIKQISYNNNFVVFGLPIISNSHKDFENILQNNIKYKLSTIQYRNFNRTNNYLVMSYDNFININNHTEKPIKIEGKIEGKIEEKIEGKNKVNKEIIQNKQNIFIVKPDILNDIYHLYLNNEYKGIACVPDYKTSVMLNNLFRNIKENNDLDALEESDDDEEFENSNVDKFVYLDKSYEMICNFNKRFKKWVPIKVYK